MKLLNTGGTNTKILKSQKGTEFKIASLSLYPDDLICTGAKLADCMRLCLKDSGFAQIFESVNNARKAKTDFWHYAPEEFKAQLIKEMKAFIVKCRKDGFKACFRLNTISDIPWHKHNIPQQFEESYFYDYTKIAARLGKTPANYDLIFSYSGAEKYQKQVKQALKTHYPISAVFRGNVPIGKYFLGREIIDGDSSDLNNTQAHHKIVGLKLKGHKAKKEKGLFIVEPWQLDKSLEYAA